MEAMITPLIIYGPTSSGKTALSIRVAQKYNCEIISADSRQVYKNLDIGTGKISFEEQYQKESGYWLVEGVRINGFDIVRPQSPFSVSDWINYAVKTSEQISKRNKSTIFCGGSGFYIYSLVNGLNSAGSPPNLQLRKSLEGQEAEKLFDKLMKINSKRAKSMNDSDKKNPRRLIRAIEVSSTKFINKPKFFLDDYLLIGLTAPNEFLYKKADKWLLKRIDLGLIKEIEELLLSGIKPCWLISLGLEYKWVTRYLLKEIGYDEMLKRLQGDTHSYIRRQKTWFRKFPEIEITDVSQKDKQALLEKRINLWYTQHTWQAKVLSE